MMIRAYINIYIYIYCHPVDEDVYIVVAVVVVVGFLGVCRWACSHANRPTIFEWSHHHMDGPRWAYCITIDEKATR
jgi:hypothetical protein